MSEQSIPEERTEMPTEKRMGQLRKEGQLHLSNDLVMVISLMSGFLIIGVMWQWFFDDMKWAMQMSFARIANPEPIDSHGLHTISLTILYRIAPHLMIVVGAIATAATLAVMLQTGWNVKEKKIKLQFSMLNPINGLKRIISINGAVMTLKAILKLSIILPIAFFALKAFAPEMVRLIHMSVSDVMAYCATGVMKLFWKITYVLIAFAIFDYFWTKHRWLKQNKMTKEEVKDERKSMEGDEETKRKIQNKGLQRIMQRLKQTVPQADVIITNPTHFAIALKYDRSTMTAPKVIAKGMDHLALRIRAIAKEAGVPILERKALARALYDATEVNTEVPRNLFKAVAEVLAYVYRLKNPHGTQAQNKAGR